LSDYPHVTKIIALVRNMDWTPEAALTKGRLVHRATALLDGAGDGSGLDYDSLHPILKPYVDAYVAWKELAGIFWTLIEEPIVVHKYRYQGRPDRVDAKVDRIIVDLKCGPDQHPSIGLQLAAYEFFFRPKLERLSVHLLPNGRFKVHEWKDRADFPLFLGLLNIHQWRIANGLYTGSRD